MLSSWGGALRKILFTLPNPVLGDVGDTDPVRLKLEAVYRALFAGVPADCKIVVLVKPGRESIARSWLEQSGVDPSRYDVRAMKLANATMWANDPFWTCRRRAHPLDPPVLVEPKQFLRAGDKSVADDLVYHLGYDNRVLARPFEAGNLLVGDDFYFIGIDTVQDLSPGVLEVGKAYRAMEAVRRPIVLGGAEPDQPLVPIVWTEMIDGPKPWNVSGPVLPQGSRQPIFHIDMYVLSLIHI